jgi:WD40 repeat protein
MDIAKIINFDRTIKKIKSLNSSQLMVVGFDNSFTLIEPLNEFKVKNQFLFKGIAKLENKDNRLDISNNSKYVAILDKKTKTLQVADFEDREFMFDIDWHRGEVESLKFDFSNRYLATGGQDGKVIIWSIESEDIVYTLPKHKDFVTALQFSKDSSYFASASFDRTISVVNLEHMDKSFILRGIHQTAIRYLYFISEHRLIAIDKQGKVALYDYIKRKFIKFIDNLKCEAVSITFLFNYHFMLIVDMFGKVHLHDLQNNQKLDGDFFSSKEKIIDLTYLSSAGLLALCTSDRVIFYNIKDDELKLKNLLVLTKYEDAYKLLNSNPFLRFSPFSKELENIWEKTKQQAVEYLKDLKINEAKAILVKFANVPSKKGFITGIINDFSNLDKFKHNIKTKNYSLVYGMANQFPSLKYTRVFQAVESDFENRISKAKDLILSNKDNIDKYIEELLYPYKAVPSKVAIIKELMSNKKVIILFNTYLHQKAWIECFDLSEKYTFLQDLADYHKLKSIEKAIYSKVTILIDNGKILETEKLLSELKKFPTYKEEIKNITKKIKVIKEFEDLIENKNYDKVVKLVHENIFLEKYPQYQRFLKKWTSTRIEALKLAKLGKVDSVLELFEDFNNMESKQSTIGHIISSTYIHRFILLKDTKEVLLGEIDKYLEVFGTTNELIHYFDYYEKKYHDNISKEFEKLEFKGYESYMK